MYTHHESSNNNTAAGMQAASSCSGWYYSNRARLPASAAVHAQRQCVPAAVYEAEEYYRASVEPQLEDGSSIAADVYVWKDQYRSAHARC